MPLNINVFAKSTLSILAVVVLIAFLLSIYNNSQELLNTAKTLFAWLIIAVVAVTFIINLPRILSRLS
ncbi:hypothetical protein KEJ24_02935 [Candidatus Bathyarchaeota archaeon]|nr:hypothetical protein [Candidatus Bathyarchaeota archaeon]